MSCTDTVFSKTGTVIFRILQFIHGLMEWSPQRATKKQHLAQFRRAISSQIDL
jgi:hypothetical protein